MVDIPTVQIIMMVTILLLVVVGIGLVATFGLPGVVTAVWSNPTPATQVVAAKSFPVVTIPLPTMSPFAPTTNPV